MSRKALVLIFEEGPNVRPAFRTSLGGDGHSGDGDEALARREALGRGVGRPAPASDVARFTEALARAKHAMNHLQAEEAESFLSRAVELDPRSAEALTLPGVVTEDRGELLAARQSSHDASDAGPGCAPAKHNLNHLTARMGGGNP